MLRLVLLFSFSLIFISCKSTAPAINTDVSNYSLSNDSITEVLEKTPDYSGQITSITGKGRAIVSEPGNSERATIDFSADTLLSLLTIKNRIGIEGGAMLVDQDSILIYYKLDNIAQKVAISDGRLTSLNELASINLIDLLHFKLTEESVVEVYESDETYLLRLATDGGVIVDRDEYLIREVRQPYGTGLPYSKLIYENYGALNGYTLPRKITILSADGNSKVVFQIRSLQLNPESLNLQLDIPSNIIIDRL
ncbi:MAG: DUF4292 domain-containing protein [Balneolaceae bacterium]|nr:DUF4292 domain-containing protein [Balneolaceae bacterium]